MYDIESLREKEEFLEKINSIPYWVKTSDDLVRFCKHLQFRLIEAQHQLRWFYKNCELNTPEYLELRKITDFFEKIYENDENVFLPFSDAQKIRK